MLAIAMSFAACSTEAEFDFTVSGDSSPEVLREALSPCPGGVESIETDVGWSGSFSEIDAWYQLAEYDGREIPRTEPAVELDVIEVATGEPTTILVLGPLIFGEDDTVASAVSWSIEEADLYLGTLRYEAGVGEGDLDTTTVTVDLVVRSMVALPDGSPFFIGECGEQWVGDGIRSAIGEDEMIDFVATALTLTGTELSDYVTGAAS